MQCKSNSTHFIDLIGSFSISLVFTCMHAFSNPSILAWKAGQTPPIRQYHFKTSACINLQVLAASPSSDLHLKNQNSCATYI